MNGTDDTLVTAPPHERVDYSAWWMVFVLLVFNILSTLDRHVIVMLVEPIQKDLGFTDFQMSLVMGPAIAITSAIAAIPLGWAADRYSRRWVIFMGVLAWSGGCAASGFSTSFGGLFASRAAVAAGEATLNPSAYSLIADRFPRRKLMTALSVYGIAPKIAISIAFALGAVGVAFGEWANKANLPIVGGLAPWQLVLLLVSVPGLLLALLAFTFKEPRASGPRAEKISTPELLQYAKQHKSMLLFLLAGFCAMGICSGAINNWAPTFVTRQFGWTPVQYGGPMSLISLLGAAAIIPKGVIVDWLYSRGVKDAPIRFFTWVQMIGLPLIVVAFLSESVYLFLFLYGIINVLTLSFTLYLSGALQIIAPSRMRGRLTATFLMIVVAATLLIGPTSVAAVTDFVIGDQSQVGKSIAIVADVSLFVSILFLRIASRKFYRFVEGSEKVA